MIIPATELKFLEGTKLELTFFDGKIVQFDMSTIFDKYPFMKPLEDRDFFLKGYLDPGGLGIIWNSDIDVATSGIYELGKVIGYKDISLNASLGSLILKTRLSKGISQDEFAELSHINQADISRIESGLGNPTLKKITKLFDALGERVEFVIKK